MDTNMKKSLSENTFSHKEINKSNDESMVLRMRRSISDKAIMLYYKEKKHKKKDENQKQKSNNRFLITINVFGSAGPIRFVVNGEDNAERVIEAALKVYAREGRLPILGSDVNSFFLYPVNAGFNAMEPSEAIGSRGGRNFVMCKKQSNPQMTEMTSSIVDSKGHGWRKWLQKSLSLKIPSP